MYFLNTHVPPGSVVPHIDRHKPFLKLQSRHIGSTSDTNKVSLWDEHFVIQQSVNQNKGCKRMQWSQKYIHNNKHLSLKMEKHESHKEKQGWNHGLLKGKQFLLHWWHPSCYSCQQSSDNLSWKGALSTGKTYSRWDNKVRL